ncbi:AI-2E family transporter [uncultured Mycolicibacterium sp.]|uniref:AI-2E family transporter n=1 Tax=uncultured Mycolicibacterium sp. TaxID=2320817 RepID=UPI0026147795|nr:AI-2E family transporter [uncultured Mycolicibacterium sp.]
MNDLDLTQRRALAVVTILALLIGAWFLSGFFILIVMAAVAAYLFSPLYERLRRRLGTGPAAGLTVLSALLIVIVPVTAVVMLAIVQISQAVDTVSEWMARTDLSSLGARSLEVVNDALSRAPFLEHTTVTPESVRDAVVTVSQHIGQWLLGVLQGAVGGVAGAIAASIVFLYVFVSLLVNRDKVQALVRRLNPLGEEITDLYLAKIGAMVRGTVKGQFVIALCQGVAGAASVYIAGFHDGFFIFAILLTALSVIPLGGGVVTIPLGIAMAFFGNVVGGVFVVLFHVLVVTNIDNFLRPVLVPRAARLDPALMLLAVFAGISMWGFWGIVIGPVLMIIIVTTISVYLAVYRGVEFDTGLDDGAPAGPAWWRRLRGRGAPDRAAPDADPDEAAPDEPAANGSSA